MTLVMVAVMLPVLVLFTGLAVDTANWWVHKRHLQNQADAAALAGATRFKYPGCDNSAIERTAIEYSGGVDNAGDYIPPDAPAPKYNFQPGTNEDRATPIHTEVNEETFWGDTNILDDDLKDAPRPCDTKFVDVKITEEDSEGFFARGWIGEIDAQARVELKKLQTARGLLPLGIEDVNPKRVHVWLFDADTGAQLGDAELERHSPENGAYVWDNRLGSSTTSPILLSNVRSGRMVLRVAISGSDSVTCGDPLVVCYGYAAPGAEFTQGFPRIRGYRTGGTGAQLRDVRLSGEGCGSNSAFDNGYFTLSCTGVSLAAALEGVTTTGPDAAEVKAHIKQGNQERVRTLAWDTALQRWTTSTPLPVVEGAGEQSIRITYLQKAGTVGEQVCTKAVPCTDEGRFTDAHAVFSGSRARSGPIQGVRIDTVTGGPGVNNVRRCEGLDVGCVEQFVVRLNIGGRLALRPVYDDQGNLLPPIALRVAGSGSQNHSLDCDPFKVDHDDDATTPAKVPDYTDEMTYGCKAAYTINDGTECLKPASFQLPQPPAWECVAIQTGTTTNKPAAGLNQRIHCYAEDAGNCPQDGKATNCLKTNQWPDWQPGDRRIVSLFLVPFGSFDSQGTGSLPVIDFAFFYITGYSGKGSGFTNPCEDYAPDPDVYAPGTKGDNGVISGYFISPTNPNLGGAGEEDCDVGTIGGCVAVMTK